MKLTVKDAKLTWLQLHRCRRSNEAAASAEFELKDPKGREFLGDDLLAQPLYALGVREVFGLHGDIWMLF
jgi:hypothetical protein